MTLNIAKAFGVFVGQISVAVEVPEQHEGHNNQQVVELDSLSSGEERILYGEVDVKEDQAVAEQVQEHAVVKQELSIKLHHQKTFVNVLHRVGLIPGYTTKDPSHCQRSRIYIGQIPITDPVGPELGEVKEALYPTGECNQRVWMLPEL